MPWVILSFLDLDRGSLSAKNTPRSGPRFLFWCAGFGSASSQVIVVAVVHVFGFVDPAR